MSIELDVVIPVKMPSQYLDTFILNTRNSLDVIRFNYVLDGIQIQEVGKSMIKSYSNEQHRFIYGNYGSPGVARNAALSKCEAKYLMFCDVDDVPIFENIYTFLKICATHRADIGIGGWMVLGETKVKSTRPISVGLNPGIWRMIFSRELVGGTTFSDAHWGEDQEFFVKMLEKKPKLFVDNLPIYKYRRDVLGSQTSNTSNVEYLAKITKNCIRAGMSTTRASRVVVITMILRQILTLIKYGKNTMKLRATAQGLFALSLLGLRVETLKSLLFYSRKFSDLD